MNAFGGLSINANTTASRIAGGVGAKITGWSEHNVSRQGSLAVVPDTTNSRLTLAAGTYEVDARVVVETEDISGTSGDGAGIITLQLYKGGEAISGAVAMIDAQAVDRPQTPTVKEIVEVTSAQVVAGTNYVELWGIATDAAGNDVTLRHARLFAKRID